MVQKRKKTLTHHLRHHAKRIRKQWQTPHTIIAVIVFLSFALIWFGYMEWIKPASFESGVNVVDTRDLDTGDEPSPVTSTQEFAVSLGQATVDQDTQTGCSAQYNFLYPITSNKAGTITFQRVRSDGVIVDPAPQTLYFAKAETKSVTYTWQADKAYEFTGYSYIQILSPKPAASNYANIKFTYLCR